MLWILRPIKDYASFCLCCLCCLLLWGSSLSAKDLGSIGNTFAIAEADLLLVIKTKLDAMQAQGLIAAQQQQMQQRVKEGVLHPKAVPLPTTKVARSRRYDPLLLVTDDIVDNNNHQLVTAGTEVNPLDWVSLRTPLLFFNSDDAAQVCWVEQQAQKQDVKLILVQGDVGKMTTHFKQVVYFDQFGRLVQQLGIRQVPAMVSQLDKHLVIAESVPCID